MALADPLGKSALADLLAATDIEFSLQWMQESSGTGGGESIYADRAPARWIATLTTGPMDHAASRATMALLNSRAGGLKTFLLYDKALPYPSTDPNGAIFGSAAPEVETIADRLHVAFTGFPGGYVLPVGTYFEIEFDSGRRYLGQFVEARTANGAGAVASVEVAPPLPASVAPGDAVTVARPSAKFRLVPGSARPTVAGALHSSVSFSAEQTYARDPS